MEADPRRQVGLDHAGDDVDRWPLRRHDQMDTRGARLLRQPLDQEFDFLARRHHQVSQLVDDDHDLRQHFIIELLFLVDRTRGFGVIAGLDPASQRLPLGLGGLHLLVVIGEIADGRRRHHPVALFHLLDRPFQRADRLGRLGHHWRQEMGNIVIGAEFQHLRIDHDHLALVGRQPVEQRQDHAVQADRFTRTGGTRDQQMRHRREIGDHRITGDILAQDDRQLAGLFGETVAADHFMQHHHFAIGVGQFDAHHGAAGNGGDARRQRRHVAGDILGQLDHAAGLDARRRFQLVHRDHRARADRVDRALDVKIVEHRFQQPRVALQPGLVDHIVVLLGRWGQQVERRQHIGPEEIALFGLADAGLFRRQRPVADLRRWPVVGLHRFAGSGLRLGLGLAGPFRLDHQIVVFLGKGTFDLGQFEGCAGEQRLVEPQAEIAEREAGGERQRDQYPGNQAAPAGGHGGEAGADTIGQQHAGKPAQTGGQFHLRFREPQGKTGANQQRGEQAPEQLLLPAGLRNIAPQPVRQQQQQRQE